jgi:hypothetical protein
MFNSEEEKEGCVHLKREPIFMLNIEKCPD